MANNQKIIKELYSKFTNVPKESYDTQLALLKIRDGDVRIVSKALSSNQLVFNESQQNKEFLGMLKDAQSVLEARKGEAECVIELNSGLMGFVENKGPMGGGMIMTLRDAMARKMPNTLCASAGRIVSEEERNSGRAIRSVVQNAFAEIEFTFSLYTQGFITFAVPKLLASENSQAEFSEVITKGAQLLATGKLNLAETYSIVNEGMAYPAKFKNVPVIYDLGRKREGAGFSIEPATGSSDYVVPLVYENLFAKSLSPQFGPPISHSLVDLEVAGGELLTTSPEKLRSLDRQVIYVYGPDARVLAFQSGKIAFESHNFYDFMVQSGLRAAVIERKTTGLLDQLRTVLFGKYDEIEYKTGSMPLAYKGALKSAFLDLWKEAKREDLITQVAT